MKNIFLNFLGVKLQLCCGIDETASVSTLKKFVANGIDEIFDGQDVYFCRNGHILHDSDLLSEDEVVYVCPRLRGGKGGFGSMLRAIGAQIEKTTNREACRDLSGRRLRDINEETRLKKWIAKQEEQKLDKVAMKIEALEKKLTLPKHEFNDSSYDKERSNISERVNDAVAQGLALAKSGVKRPAAETTVKSKKPKLWLGIDEELDDSDVSSSDEDSAGSSGDHNKNSSNINNGASTSTAEKPISSSANEESSADDKNSETLVPTSEISQTEEK